MGGGSAFDQPRAMRAILAMFSARSRAIRDRIGDYSAGESLRPRPRVSIDRCRGARSNDARNEAS